MCTFSLVLDAKLAKLSSSVFLLQPSSSYPLIGSKYGPTLKIWADNLWSNKKKQTTSCRKRGKKVKRKGEKSNSNQRQLPSDIDSFQLVRSSTLGTTQILLLVLSENPSQVSPNPFKLLLLLQKRHKNSSKTVLSEASSAEKYPSQKQSLQHAVIKLPSWQQEHGVSF